MLLWIGFAVLTAAVLAALARPFRDAPDNESSDPRQADIAVYRDQLSEVDADLSRGLLTPAEAEAARAEIGRRLIERAGKKCSSSEPAPAAAATLPARAALVAVPLAAVALYLLYGSPALPGQPLAARVTAPGIPNSAAELIAKVEERLRLEPNDGRGWDVIAPVYMRMGRVVDARHAFEQAIRIQGESPKRLMGLAEAMLIEGNGIVSEDIRKISERLIALEPDRIEPRIWIVLAKEQDGKLKDAAEGYRSLLAAAPADAPWREPVEQRLKAVEARLEGKPVPETAETQPSEPQTSKIAPPPAEAAGQVAAMAPADRAAFINRMVEGLAEKLKADGKNLAGWQQLVRALKVLERDAEAKTALADARKNFAGDDKALAELDSLAKSLGLGS